jgi:hypothetical protein
MENDYIARGCKKLFQIAQNCSLFGAYVSYEPFYPESIDNETPLHALIHPGDIKAILGIVGREDALIRYCLITATYTIEQYCRRRLVRKKYADYLTFTRCDDLSAAYGLTPKKYNKGNHSLVLKLW